MSDKNKTKAQRIEKLQRPRRRVSELEGLQSQLERAEQALEQYTAQMKLLSEIGGKIIAVQELDRVLDRAAHLVQESFSYENVALLTIDHEQDELVVKAISGIFARPFPPGHRLKLGQGMTGWVGRHGETLLANDVDAEPRYTRLYPSATTVSELSVPIRVGEEVVGVLDIQSSQRDAFGENDVLVMEALADQIAVAIENARLHEAARHGISDRKQSDRALWESEMRFRSIAETASDAIVIFDEDETIFFWNSAAKAIFHYEAGETRGKLLDSIIVRQFSEALREEMRQVASAGAAELTGKTIETTGIRKNGTEFPMELSLATWRTKEETFFTMIARDVTERKQMEDRLNTVYTLGQQLVLSKETAEIAQSVLDATWRVLQFPTCSLWLADENQKAAIRQGHRRGAGPPKLTALPLDDERGIIASVIRSGEPIYVSDVSQEPRYVDGGSQSHSELCVPLKAGGRIIGALNAESEQLNGFSPADMQLLEALANTAAVALENARLYRETQQLAAFNEGIIRTMAEGIAMQDAAGYFTFVNPALATMLGYTPDELLGQHWSVTVPPSQQSIIQAVNERRAHGEADQYELELIRKDGTLFPALISGIPRFEEGCFVGTLAVCTDITARKLAEEALKRRATQLALINDIGGKVAAVLELDSVLDRAARLTQESFGYHHVALFTLDPEQNALVMRARAGDFAHLFPPDHRLKLGQGMVGWVGLHGERLLTGDVGVEPRYVNLYPDTITTQSELTVPIRAGEEVVGVLDLQSPQRDAFSENDVLVMETLADQIAVAIDNARLYEETTRRLAETRMLQEITTAAASTLDPDQVLTRAIQVIHHAMGIEHLNFALPSETGDYLLTHPCYIGFDFLPDGGARLSLEESVCGRVYSSGQPELIADTSNISYYFSYGTVPALLSELAVPVRVGDRVIGVLNAESPRPNAFSEDDLRLFEAIATQLGIVFENARLFDEARSRAEELAALNELGQALTTRLSVDEVLNEAYRQTSRLLDTTNFTIGLYDPDKDEITFPFFATESEIDGQILVMPTNQGMNGYVIRNRTSLLIRENLREWHEERGIEAVGEPSLCWLGVPLLVGDRVLGVMSVQSFTTPRLYGEHDRDLLTAIASQTAIALQNAYLFEETRSRAQRLAVVNRIAKVAGSTLHLDDLLEAVYQELAPAFQPEASFIALYDENSNEMDFRLLVDEGIRQPRERRPLGPGLTSIIITERKPIISRDEQEYAHLLPSGHPFGTGRVPASWLGVPLLVGERVIGVINVQSYQSNVWDEEDELLLFTIADQVAVAIENARLFDEARSRAEELAALNELGQALTTRLSVDEVLEGAYRQASRLLDTTNFGIVLYDPERHELNFAINISESKIDKKLVTIPADQGISGYVVRNRTSVLIQGNLREWQEERGVESVGEPALCWLGVPLIVGDQVLGMIGIQSFTDPRAYEEHDRDLLTSIASQVAIALQNAYLFEETRNRAQRLAVVNRIAKVAGTTLDLDNLLEAVYEELAPAFQPEASFIALYDEKTNEMDFRLLIDEGVRQPAEQRQLGPGLTSIIITERKPLISRTEQEFARLLPASHQFGTSGKTPASWLGVPMLVGERVVGVINVQACYPNAWDEEDEALLFTIADQVAVAIENARLYEAVQQELAERKQAEEALAQKAQELARSNTELEQFAYVASHDLQEPLRMVRSYLQLLERRYKDQLDESAHEFIEFAVDGATRMQTLINDLLTYSRVTTRGRPFQPVNCSTVLDFAFTDLKIAIEESGALVTHDPLPTVVADETQLKQVFQNLIGNGIKFRKKEIRPEIHVGAERQDGKWMFSVHDNGIGIEPQHFERVFEIFQRLHGRDEYPGTGIGLAVCKKIVERHGGRIWVESEPGQGSTFCFTIPDREESLS